MGGKTVLIVDDEPGIVRFVATVLRSNGYGVLEATDPLAALQLAEKHAGTIDLLLTDVRMPGLRGPELCERLRPQRPEAHYLLMSGDANSIETLGLPFLAKPFLIPELLQCVEQVLGAAPGQPAERARYVRAASRSSDGR